jgi:hypothetical protein
MIPEGDSLLLPPKYLETIQTSSQLIEILEILSINDQRSRTSSIRIQGIMCARHHLRKFDIRLYQARKVVLRIIPFSWLDFA